jgi:hypothetical protein
MTDRCLFSFGGFIGVLLILAALIIGMVTQ